MQKIAFSCGSSLALLTCIASHAEERTPQNNASQTAPVCQVKCGPLNVELFGGLGYRYDRQATEIAMNTGTRDPAFKVNYKDRQTVQAVLGFNFEFYGCFLELQGDYGWLVHGEADHFIAPIELSDFDMNSGYTADAQASFGYLWKIVKRDNLTFSLVPAGGYKYWHINSQLGEKSINFLDSDGLELLVDHFPKPDQQDWFGPYLQAGVDLKFCKHWDLSLFYQYHFLHVRAETTFNSAGDLFVNNVLTRVALVNENHHIRSNDAHANVGGLDFNYSNASWTYGVHFEGSKLFAHGAKDKVEGTLDIFNLTRHPTITSEASTSSQIEWTVYSTYLYAGYNF